MIRRARVYTRDAKPDELQMFAQVRPDGQCVLYYKNGQRFCT